MQLVELKGGGRRADDDAETRDDARVKELGLLVHTLKVLLMGRGIYCGSISMTFKTSYEVISGCSSCLKIFSRLDGLV